MDRFRFVIVGSGWRSLYYVRIAKALPQVFELCAMLCRTEEKASRMAAENGITTTVSEEQCIAMKPDFVVVAVNKASVAEVAMHWMELGFCVLSETPAALELPILERMWRMHKAGRRIVVNEQYRRYPIYSSIIRIAQSGILGGNDSLNASLAHEYHGMSLIRALLGIDCNEQFSVEAKTYSFPVTETLTRHEEFKDGKTAMKNRVVATFRFANGKVAFYDFDSEQYRSPIRRNTLRLLGPRGEIIDDKVYWLDGSNTGRSAGIEVSARKVRTPYDNPNLREIEEVTSVDFNGERIYGPPFGECALAQDETAMAVMMRETALYGKGLAPSPYPLEEALQDAYAMILLQKACGTGEEVCSEPQIWN